MPDIAGVYSSVASSTVTFTDWWLMNLDNPSENYIPIFYGSVLKRSQKLEEAVFSPLNRSKNVVLYGVMRGERLTLPFEAITQQDFDKFNAIRASKVSLLLKRGYSSEQWYIALGAERDVDEAGYDQYFRRWVMEAIEVDPPP